MSLRWFVIFIGYLCISLIQCQNADSQEYDTEVSGLSDETQIVGLTVVDGSPKDPMNNSQNSNTSHVISTEIILTTTTTVMPSSETIACHECTNCHLTTNLVTRVCEPGVTMCYKMLERINKVTRIVRRGCSTSKEQCTVPDIEQQNSVDGITCCIGHKCNQAGRLSLSFFLSSLCLVSILFLNINT